MIFLVHHADAVGPDVDPGRPLSSGGRATAERLAFDAFKKGVRPECVWHSGKMRARQTAEIFWRACNPLATLTAERALQPGDPPVWMRDRLLGDSRDLMVVGHMPHLDELLCLMTQTGGPEGPPLPTERRDGPAFPLHGIVALEAADDGRWVERWRIEAGGRS